MTELQEIRIFTDGSSRGNPGPGGWGAIVMYPRGNGDMRVDELGGSKSHTTNNKMEITAAIEALVRFDEYYDRFDGKQFTIFTDSQYLINGITKWVFGWQKNDWITSQKTEVANADLWRKLIDAVKGKKIVWSYVAGHAETPGNNRCDEIATTFADGAGTELYKGPLAGYEINLFDLPVVGASGEKKSSSSKNKGKAYSYVSMIDGVVQTHQTWVDTEARVKGKSGAKYKKSYSAADEQVIINEWRKHKK